MSLLLLIGIVIGAGVTCAAWIIAANWLSAREIEQLRRAWRTRPKAADHDRMREIVRGNVKRI